MKPEQPKAADWKKKVVAEYEKLLNEYPIVGAIDMESLPTKQLQNMREQLRGEVVLKMSKRRLMLIALKEGRTKKPGLDKLEKHLVGMPALLFTKENPFTLYKKLKKNKSTAPAKAGQIAPKDIVVTAGATPFAPGPIIGELGALKIKTGIENGKVAIKQDAVVVKEGEVIKANVAGILTRLGIEPMEIGLNLVAVYENGEIIGRSVLDIDEDAYVNNMKLMALEAFSLAVGIGFATEETIVPLIQKAHRDARGVGISSVVLEKDLVPDILARSEAQCNGLKQKLGL